MVVGARQIFKILRQVTRFFGNYKALSKFSHEILYFVISVTKLLKDSARKNQFYINQASELDIT